MKIFKILHQVGNHYGHSNKQLCLRLLSILRRPKGPAFVNVSGDNTSYINRTKPFTKRLASWQVLYYQKLPFKVKTTNNETHLLTNALQSSTALYEYAA